MPFVPAICGNCGAVFSTGALLGPGVSGISFINSKSTCPNCGELARIPDGTYSAVGSALKILIDVGDAEASLDAINRMKGIVDANPHADPKDVFREIGPQASEALAKSAPGDPEQRRLWQAALLGALAFAFEKFPAGVLNWIELAEKARELLGFSGQ